MEQMSKPHTCGHKSCRRLMGLGCNSHASRAETAMNFIVFLLQKMRMCGWVIVHVRPLEMQLQYAASEALIVALCKMQWAQAYFGGWWEGVFLSKDAV